MSPAQPYEGITPFPADGFPLELDDSMLPLRLLVRNLARELRAAAACHPGSRHQGVASVMNNPKRGDLVVEISTSYRTTLDATLGGFGVLLERRHEWQTTDKDFALECARQDAAYGPRTPQEHAEDRFTETAWYVQYGPGPEHVFRWVDAECVAVPFPASLLVKAKEQWP